ncbi:MAG: hypothetical protein IIT40_11145, partial [Prevotella sp.]|nr:hypothetical protein [Prevotella sp.]
KDSPLYHHYSLNYFTTGAVVAEHGGLGKSLLRELQGLLLACCCHALAHCVVAEHAVDMPGESMVIAGCEIERGITTHLAVAAMRFRHAYSGANLLQQFLLPLIN